jgi:hypothetical protein
VSSPCSDRILAWSFDFFSSCVFACLVLPAVAIAGERWTIGLSTSGAPIEAVSSPVALSPRPPCSSWWT